MSSFVADETGGVTKRSTKAGDFISFMFAPIKARDSVAVIVIGEAVGIRSKYTRKCFRLQSVGADTESFIRLQD